MREKAYRNGERAPPPAALALSPLDILSALRI
jgi:hypothetical protein